MSLCGLMLAALPTWSVVARQQANTAEPQGRRGSSDREEKEADASAAAADEKTGGTNTGNSGAAATAAFAGPGAAIGVGGQYLGYTGADPVTGQLVRSGELVKASPAEVDEYLKHYNELDAGDEGRGKDKGKDGAGAAGAEGRDTGGRAGDGGGYDPYGGGGGRGGVNEAFGVGGGDNARGIKNNEGRARDSAPVASAGVGSYRQNHNGTPTAG